MTPATVLVAVFFLIPTLLSYKKLVYEQGCLSVSSDGWPLSWCSTTPSPFWASSSGRNCSIPPSSLTGKEKRRSLTRAYGELGTGYAGPEVGVLPEALLTTR